MGAGQHTPSAFHPGTVPPPRRWRLPSTSRYPRLLGHRAGHRPYQRNFLTPGRLPGAPPEGSSILHRDDPPRTCRRLKLDSPPPHAVTRSGATGIAVYLGRTVGNSKCCGKTLDYTHLV